MATGSATTEGRVLTIRYPRRHAGQVAVATSSARYNWLAAGRRWRKTTLMMSIAVYRAAHGEQIIWGAPTYDQVMIGWGEARRAAGSVAQFVESRRVAKFPGGGSISYRSLDNPDNARGHTADGVVIDEAGDVCAEAWYEVLLPVLMSTGGWAWVIGTPKGRNWFCQEWIRASQHEVPGSVSWTAPTLGVALNNGQLLRVPHPLENPEIAFEEIATLHHSMPERSFRQEILAEFIDDAGGVFRGVRALATLSPGEYDPAHIYVIGADWGRTGDFTVFSVVDATTREQVALDRFNQVDYEIQRGRLLALCERWHPAVVIAESNAMGQPIIDAIARQKIPVQGFTTSNASKQLIIDALALAFERADIHLLDDITQLSELEGYESSRLPGGGIRYAAPEGMHDDTVMALALAWEGAQTSTDWARVVSLLHTPPAERTYANIIEAHQHGQHVERYARTHEFSPDESEYGEVRL